MVRSSFSVFLSVLLALQVYCVLPSWATVEVSNGGITGQVSVNKIGSLSWPDGEATFSGNVIEIKSRDVSQLRGVLFKTESDEAENTIAGDVYFSDGPAVKSLDAQVCSHESVDKIDGTTVRGRISDVTTEQVTCAGQSIPMTQVKAIHSNRVFKFRMKASRMTFEPTCLAGGAVTKTEKSEKVTTTTKTTSSCDNHRTLKRIIVCAVCACGLACAIAIPIALTCGHGGHHNQGANPAAAFFASRLVAPAAPAVHDD